MVCRSKRLYFRESSEPMVACVPSIFKHDKLSSLRSPFYCMPWFPEMAQNLSVGRSRISVTYLSTVVSPVSTVNCTAGYWLTLSFIPRTQITFWLSPSRLRQSSFCTPGLSIPPVLFYTAYAHDSLAKKALLELQRHGFH